MRKPKPLLVHFIQEPIPEQKPLVVHFTEEPTPKQKDQVLTMVKTRVRLANGKRVTAWKASLKKGAK